MADRGAAQIFVDALQWLRENGRILLHGYSLMPDHAHVVITVLKPYTVSQVMKSLKSSTGKQIGEQRGRPGPFWAPGFHEHAMRTEAELRAYLTYVLENPRRGGLTGPTEEHPFTRVYQGREKDLDPW